MPSTHIANKLERAKTILANRPDLARSADGSATATLSGGLRCEITGTDGQLATTDLPKSIGGEDSSATPGWYLRAAMAACTATSIAMQAAVLGITLDSLTVSAHSESDVRGLLGVGDASPALYNLRMEVKIAAKGATAQQLVALVEWGEAHSPISSTLRERSNIALDVQVL